MRRFVYVLVVMLGLVLLLQTGPAYSDFTGDADGGLADTDDGAGGPVPSCSCPGGGTNCTDCQEGEPGYPLDGDVDGGIQGMPINPPAGGTQGGMATDMEAVAQQLNGGFAAPGISYSAHVAWSENNGLRISRSDGVQPVCIGMWEDTTEIGGIKLKIPGALAKVAKIYKFGMDGEEPVGETRTWLAKSRVRITINRDVYTVYTDREMPSSAMVNYKLMEAISSEWELIDRGEYYIVGMKHATGERPAVVHVQAADDGLLTMHVELRPTALWDEHYDLICGDDY